jgi:ornithine cyclodeaminase/alanine dehydrogenase-like protein (mu-crystallin family)
MDGAYIAGMRTGAAAAVATKYLARHAAGKVALIGRGVVGGSALTVIVKVRKLGNVTVYDIIPYHTRKYVEEMEAKLRTTVTSAQDPDAAVRKADIIVTVTTLEAGISRRPNLTGCAH